MLGLHLDGEQERERRPCHLDGERGVRLDGVQEEDGEDRRGIILALRRGGMSSGRGSGGVGGWMLLGILVLLLLLELMGISVVLLLTVRTFTRVLFAAYPLCILPHILGF